MALSWNEIKDRALLFSKEYAEDTYEDGEAKSFLDAFFDVFGVSRRRFATFETKIKKIDGKDGFIDLIWKGVILIEMKSRGKDLNRAYNQATDYFSGLKDSELPRYIMVSDFEQIKLYDLETNKEWQFHTKELHKKIKIFGFLAGYTQVEYKESDPVNIKAAEKMGQLHDALKENGFSGHELELYLVRLLFCLFADDTAIFNKNIFYEYISSSNEDGSDLSEKLAKLFQVLNTPPEKRMITMSEELNAFPYINGGLFKEALTIPDFNSKMRSLLLNVCNLNWGDISPAIFGAMFQSVMNQEERRHLGAHYTSEKNIQKVIKPLFLDELYEEFEASKNNKKKLEHFHDKLSNLKFLDPACGCGNFLVITYRELRELELEVLKVLYGKQMIIDISFYVKVNVSQFYGIEIEEFPSLIAKTAMWLIDHQMNLKVSEEFGQYFARLPLKEEAHIYQGNALTMDWNNIVDSSNLNYIMGNPPFIGARLMNNNQKEEMKKVFKDLKNSGNLDYVASWYEKACDYIKKTNIEVAFVSTNSICQGEQVSILWKHLFGTYKISINFAHQTFKWANDAKGKAAVFCVIVGFSNNIKEKKLYTYSDVMGDPTETTVNNINGYLVNGRNIIIEAKHKPICDVSEMNFGSMPNDGGNLILTEDEKNCLVADDIELEKFVKFFIGADEFLNNKKRYCIWLVGANPAEYKNNKFIAERIQNVKTLRESSNRLSTKKLALFPMLFGEIRQPKSNYLMFPGVSSEKRKYLPIGYFGVNVIASNATLIIPNASLYEFGILTSNMHMAWTKYVCGRLEMRYRYSASIVYNNFPWPKPTEKQKEEITKLAQDVLDARALYKDSSLADLYDPLFMPAELVKAHNKLDKAVENAYGITFKNDADRAAHLFDLYNALVS